MSTAAVALGACMIEKHFTLDKSKIGMDNQMALEPEEMSQLVKNCHNVQQAMGMKDRIVLEEEFDQRKIMRRSIVSKYDLKEGDIIKKEDLDVKRPGTGIPPSKLNEIIGQRLIDNIEADVIIDGKLIKRNDID